MTIELLPGIIELDMDILDAQAPGRADEQSSRQDQIAQKRLLDKILKDPQVQLVPQTDEAQLAQKDDLALARLVSPKNFKLAEKSIWQIYGFLNKKAFKESFPNRHAKELWVEQIAKEDPALFAQVYTKNNKLDLGAITSLVLGMSTFTQIVDESKYPQLVYLLKNKYNGINKRVRGIDPPLKPEDVKGGYPLTLDKPPGWEHWTFKKKVDVNRLNENDAVTVINAIFPNSTQTPISLVGYGAG